MKSFEILPRLLFLRNSAFRGNFEPSKTSEANFSITDSNVANWFAPRFVAMDSIISLPCLKKQQFEPNCAENFFDRKFNDGNPISRRDSTKIRRVARRGTWREGTCILHALKCRHILFLVRETRSLSNLRSFLSKKEFDVRVFLLVQPFSSFLTVSVY